MNSDEHQPGKDGRGKDGRSQDGQGKNGHGKDGRAEPAKRTPKRAEIVPAAVRPDTAAGPEAVRAGRKRRPVRERLPAASRGGRGPSPTIEELLTRLSAKGVPLSVLKFLAAHHFSGETVKSIHERFPRAFAVGAFNRLRIGETKELDSDQIYVAGFRLDISLDYLFDLDQPIVFGTPPSHEESRDTVLTRRLRRSGLSRAEALDGFDVIEQAKALGVDKRDVLRAIRLVAKVKKEGATIPEVDEDEDD